MRFLVDGPSRADPPSRATDLATWSEVLPTLSRFDETRVQRYAAPVSYCDCRSVQLCEGCYGRELTSKRGQARVLGETWAERICRGELRQHECWPRGDPKTLTVAIRLVKQLTSDPRLAAELAAICDAGAAAWWARRPARYRA